MAGCKTVEVILADKHARFRSALRELLETRTELRVVAEAVSGEEALSLARALAPHLLLLDSALPDMSALEAIAKLRDACPSLRILILSLYPHRQYDQALREAGACAFLAKDHAFEELLPALTKIGVLPA